MKYKKYMVVYHCKADTIDTLKRVKKRNLPTSFYEMMTSHLHAPTTFPSPLGMISKLLFQFSFSDAIGGPWDNFYGVPLKGHCLV